MGSKPSKPGSIDDQTLSEETIAELCGDTGFTEEELRNWHANFLRDCPDGKLTLKQFEHEYAKIMGKPTQKTSDYVKHMFNVYDQDKNQFIDFREFVMALSAASVVNRLRLVETLFHVFDLDDDGKITKEEIGKMLHTLVDVTSKSGKHHHHQQQTQIDLQQRIDDAFNELNTNDDDHITKDEFIDWYMRSGLLADAKADEINVANTSRIQQISKKTRKSKKQQQLQQKKSGGFHSQQTNGGVNRHSTYRHMSRMTEHKTPMIAEVSDEENDENIERGRRLSGPDLEDHEIGPAERRPSNIEIRTSLSATDDSDSHYSKENERWQHLFNSVLGQIRDQRRSHGQNRPTTTTTHNGQSPNNNFNAWKRDGEEKIKFEYLRQKSSNTNEIDHHHLSVERAKEATSSSSISKDRSSSPDIVTVRL